MTTQSQTIISKKFSGDYRIDVLLDDVKFRWNTFSPLGTEVQIPFAFLTTPASNASAEDKNGFTPFSAVEMNAVRQILTEISKLLKITFVEVSESTIQQGIRFANNIQTDSAGYAMLPQPAEDGKNFLVGSGDLYMASNQINDPSFAVGTYEFATLVHEIGHALGLNHPGNYNAGEPPKTEAGNYLASAEDNKWISIMSYNGVAQEQNRSFFGTYDMLALKYLYGSREYNAENNDYAFVDSHGRILQLINDTGGIDTIDVSATSVGAKISLEPGAQSSIGTLADGATPAINSLSIAYDAIIENVIGTRFDDTLIGNNADNTLSGGGGNNAIDGRGGHDIAVFAGNRNTYTLQNKGDGQFLVEKPNSQGSDSLLNVEALKFADMNINLGVGEKSKTVDANALKSLIELYIAYFNRVPDADGMNYWIGEKSAGANLEQIGQSFYNAAVSPAFTSLTGYSNEMSNIDFIKIIYKNVLGRNEVDQGGLDYWSSALSSGSQTRGSLIKTILDAAHGFKGKPDYGYVADLLDNKYIVGKYFAIDQGINYNTPEESYAKGVAIAAAVTATSVQAALNLIGISDQGFSLT